jgi:uncharacterized membrane protein
MAWASFLLSAVALGGLVTIIVPILASAWSVFITVILIEENRRGMSVIVRAREFTRNRWWLIFGYLFMNGIIIVLLFLPFIIAGGVLMAMVGTSTGATQILSLIFTAIVSVIPFYLVVWTVCLYQHLKAKRGHAEPFPKPGQMKWYWILFGLGMLLPVIIISLMSYRAFFALTGR